MVTKCQTIECNPVWYLMESSHVYANASNWIIVLFNQNHLWALISARLCIYLGNNFLARSKINTTLGDVINMTLQIYKVILAYLVLQSCLCLAKLT